MKTRSKQQERILLMTLFLFLEAYDLLEENLSVEYYPGMHRTKTVREEELSYCQII